MYSLGVSFMKSLNAMLKDATEWKADIRDISHTRSLLSLFIIDTA